MKYAKYMLSLLMMAALTFTATSCSSDDNEELPLTIKAEGLVGNKVSIAVGETLQLSCPENGYAVWISGDDAIATVDGSGLVTALKQGRVLITVKNSYDGVFHEHIILTVQGGALTIDTDAIDQSLAE